MIDKDKVSEISELLQQGLEKTGMMVGILSRVDDETYTVMVNEPKEALSPGDHFRLGETVCTLVCEQGGPVAFHTASSVGFETHPAYDKFNIESYIGAPVTKNGVFYGTINFSDVNERTTPFAHSEIAFVSALARRVSEILSA